MGGSGRRLVGTLKVDYEIEVADEATGQQSVTEVTKKLETASVADIAAKVSQKVKAKKGDSYTITVKSKTAVTKTQKNVPVTVTTSTQREITATGSAWHSAAVPCMLLAMLAMLPL